MAGSGTGTPVTPPTTTVEDIIERALVVIGVLSDGGDATANQLDTGLFHFNSMQQYFSGLVNHTWLRKTTTLTLVAADGAYVMADELSEDPPVFIHNIVADYSTGSDYSQIYPLNKISKAEYMRLGNRISAGRPTQYYYDQTYTAGGGGGTLYIWPVPAAADLPIVLEIDYTPRNADSTSGEAPYLPPIWIEAAVYNLAVRLAENYGRPVTQTLMGMAASSLAMATSQDFEDASFSIQPDPRYVKGY